MMEKLERALTIMANVTTGLPVKDLTAGELEHLEILVKIGLKAKSILQERECEEMFCRDGS